MEDVLDLGQEIEVKVEDIDPNGKISLVSPVKSSRMRTPTMIKRIPRRNSTKKESEKPSSFEDEFEESLAEELGELGLRLSVEISNETETGKGKVGVAEDRVCRHSSC